MGDVFKNGVFDHGKYNRFKKFVADCVVDAMRMTDAGILGDDGNLSLKYMKVKAREIYDMAEMLGIRRLYAFEVSDEATKVITKIIYKIDKVDIGFLVSTIETLSFDECRFEELEEGVEFAFDRAEMKMDSCKYALIRILNDFAELR